MALQQNSNREIAYIARRLAQTLRDIENLYATTTRNEARLCYLIDTKNDLLEQLAKQA